MRTNSTIASCSPPRRARPIMFAAALAMMMLPPPCGAAVALAPEVGERLAALDCRRVGAADVASTLSRAPAPRIIALQGSVPIVTMEPFAAFLQAMGYPAERLRKPGSDASSHSSFIDSRRLAGEIAWHYERDGLMPMLIGHSQGGMVVLKMLHDLAGTREATPIPVWNPMRDAAEPRTSITDPITGEARAVTDLKIDYAAVLVTGSLPRLLLGQWGMLPLLRDVPDSVADFTGFSIPWDPIAGTGGEPAPYRATGTARVRDVVLPASYSHVMLPRALHLALQPSTRAWIDRYEPDARAPPPTDADATNLLHAADIWFSVKQHWCAAAQRLAAQADIRRR